MIDKKWKWVAKDKSGTVFMYTGRPKIVSASVWYGDSHGFLVCSANIISLPGDWKDSLHEIIHHEDGKIEFRKARPELKIDDPVLVKDNDGSRWAKAHFAGWDGEKICTWVNGRTSFTAYDTFSWRYYKLP